MVLFFFCPGLRYQTGQAVWFPQETFLGGVPRKGVGETVGGTPLLPTVLTNGGAKITSTLNGVPAEG